MSKELIIKKCEKCGAMVRVIEDCNCKDCGIECCGNAMNEVEANSVDAAFEKHVPVFEVKGDVVEVKVGAVEHPMIPEHFIEWIALKTKQGNQRKALKPGEAPKACFRMCEGDEVEAVYAYCNLHSLWKAE